MKFKTITETRAALQKGDISAVDLVQQTINNIKQSDENLNAFLEITEETALQAAADIKPDDDRSLAGIPIGVKDMICTVEGHTTAASKMLQNFTSPFDATVVKKLKDAGAIVIGKLNCDEFAMGASAEYSAFGPVKNPWDLNHVAGGSSGGSAAAIGGGEVLGTLGTDTGGSVRMPANFCGVVGLRPTYGRVSRFGVISYASSFDQVGPLARTVKDTAQLLEVLAGVDSLDATTSNQPVGKYTEACLDSRDISGLTIGVPEEFFTDDVDPEIQKTIRAAIKQLEQLGAKTKTISLSLTYAGIPTYYLLVKSEASSNLARFDGLRYSPLDLASPDLLQHYLDARGQYFGPEVKRSILMGTYALSAGYVDAWYKQASKVRTLIRREVEAAFKEVDLIAGPSSPMPAFPLGAKTDDPLAMYLVDLLMEPASVSGTPAISVPAGFVEVDGKKLPVGLQLIAPHFQESRLFQVAHVYEQSQNWWQMTPE